MSSIITINKNDMYSLTFVDLTVLKQFIEKAVRENFFNYQEIPGIEILLNKLNNILQKKLSENTN